MRKIFNNVLYAYIVVSYFMMFVILYENRNLSNRYDRNIIEVLTASAPITILYLIIKNYTNDGRLPLFDVVKEK